MPNWCKNNLKIEGNGEKILELLELLKDEDGQLTFNKLVPLPKELEGTTSPTPDTVTEEEKKRLMDKYGATNWYDWRIKNWGCKWDASESDFYKYGDEWTITFETPWGPPIEFMKSLSKQFGKMIFKLQFADETQSNYPLGEVTFSNGEDHVEGPLEDTPQAREFAQRVWDEEWVDDWEELEGDEDEESSED